LLPQKWLSQNDSQFNRQRLPEKRAAFRGLSLKTAVRASSIVQFLLSCGFKITELKKAEKTTMRLIGELNQPQAAERLAAFLLTQGITTKIDETKDGVQEVWAREEDQFEAAHAEFLTFVQSPDDPKYVFAVSAAAKIAREQEKKRREMQKRMMKVGTGGVSRKPTLTLIMIGISVVVALATDFGAKWSTSDVVKAMTFISVPPPASLEILQNTPGSMREKMDSLNVRLASLKRGEIWRLITPIFLHHGTFHILFNMLWLFQLGKLIENRYGFWQMLMLVVLSAALSNFASGIAPEAWGGGGPGVSQGYLLDGSGGMSGVVYALFGFVWMRSLYDRSSGFHLPQSTVYLLVGWLFFCMIPGMTQNLFKMNVNNWAHAIGLIVGLAVGYLPVWWQQYRRASGR
jgi:GlpG protein